MSRRSVSLKRLENPGPGPNELERMIPVAFRAPAHGGMRPWRAIEFGPAQREQLAGIADRARARKQATPPPVLLGVCGRAGGTIVPPRDQWLAAGAALGNWLNAAQQLAYGASVLNGERCFEVTLSAQLDFSPDQSLAGFVRIGSIRNLPPAAAPVAVGVVVLDTPIHG